MIVDMILFEVGHTIIVPFV